MDRQAALVLRPGRGNPLFLFSGGGGDLRELDPLVAALQTRRPLICIPYWEQAEDGTAPASVEAMAEGALNAIRSCQSSGPYWLVGYSLGGLVAVEVARRLIDAGHSVRPPILVDASTHKSAWPLPIFVRAGVRYALHRARRLLGGGSAAAAIAAPADEQPDAVGDRCREARARYRPTRFNGRVTLLDALDEPYVGGLAPLIWRELALRVDTFPLAARHLEVLRIDSVVAAVARIVDGLVDSSDDKRRALVLTGVSWDVTASLAHQLDRVGFAVEALAPAGHPLSRVEGLTAFHTLQALNPRGSIEAALMACRPDILIPGDDFVTDLLHELHGTTQDAGVRALIERSLGLPQFYAAKYSRVRMTEIAASVGAAIPCTVSVEKETDLAKQLERTGQPAFLKIDRSWGGTGVDRVVDLAEAKRAWRRRAGPSLLPMVRGIKRALFNGDVSCLSQWRGGPVFSLQAAEEGLLVIVSAACRNGELLGMISARVLSQQSTFGPAATIQLDDTLPVRDTVASIIRRLGLSGLCGFDFILSSRDGIARFVELNPRATQTSAFLSARDRDPLAALLDSLGGRSHTRKALVPNGAIVKIADILEQLGVGTGDASTERAQSPQ